MSPVVPIYIYRIYITDMSHQESTATRVIVTTYAEAVLTLESSLLRFSSRSRSIFSCSTRWRLSPRLSKRVAWALCTGLCLAELASFFSDNPDELNGSRTPPTLPDPNIVAACGGASGSGPFFWLALTCRAVLVKHNGCIPGVQDEGRSIRVAHYQHSPSVPLKVARYFFVLSKQKSSLIYHPWLRKSAQII
jgi:hypothetical protein